MLQAEEQQPLQKRRRTGANVSSGTLSTAQSNQSHPKNEEGDTGGAISTFEVVVEKPSFHKGPRKGQGQALGTRHRVVTVRAVARAHWLLGLLAGRVYELTYGELQALATSDEIQDQIQGQILLTDPYDISYLPFITIRISRELRYQFAKESVQVM